MDILQQLRGGRESWQTFDQLALVICNDVIASSMKKKDERTLRLKRHWLMYMEKLRW